MFNSFCSLCLFLFLSLSVSISVSFSLFLLVSCSIGHAILSLDVVHTFHASYTLENLIACCLPCLSQLDSTHISFSSDDLISPWLGKTDRLTRVSVICRESRRIPGEIAKSTQPAESEFRESACAVTPRHYAFGGRKLGIVQQKRERAMYTQQRRPTTSHYTERRSAWFYFRVKPWHQAFLHSRNQLR